MKPSKRYTVQLSHDAGSGWWVAQLAELPAVITQGRTIEQSMERVREALWAFTDDQAGAQSAVLQQEIMGLPKPLLSRIEKARTAKQRAEAEQARAGVIIRSAAAELSNRGLSARDVGELLGVSRQRAHQLLKTG